MEFSRKIGNKKSIDFINSNKEVIFSSTDFCGEEIHTFSTELLKKLYKIEEYYKVKLVLPKSFSDDDNVKINLLLDIAEKGYSDKIVFCNNDSYVADKHKLEKLYNSGIKNNQFCVVSKQPFKVELSGVNIDIFDATLYGGVYSIDVSDIKHKYTTFAR